MSSGAGRTCAAQSTQRTDSYSGPTTVLLGFYSLSTSLLPPSWSQKQPKTGGILDLCTREENISVENAETSTSRHTHYHLLTQMTVTPPQVRKSVEKCRILWNLNRSPETHGKMFSVAGRQSPLACAFGLRWPPDQSSMNAPRTNLAQLNKRLRRQATTGTCIAATTS